MPYAIDPDNAGRLWMISEKMTSKGRVFLSCKKEVHYSRELILSQHALLHIFTGTMEISYGNYFLTFHSGDTVLVPRNQLGRLTKLPQSNKTPFKSISIFFPEELLRKYYAAHPVDAWPENDTRHRTLARHPLLESLFNSLLPYFAMHEELPDDITEVKILEALTVINAMDKQAGRILGSFQEPGKIDLADYMEQYFMYNLSLEKFACLTGRSLTTFKKDWHTTRLPLKRKDHRTYILMPGLKIFPTSLTFLKNNLDTPQPADKLQFRYLFCRR